MKTTRARNPERHDLDRFLGARVGEDRNGRTVTVVSTLARQGFDPGQVAADLACLSRGAARARIETILEGFYDVPSLMRERGPVAERLSALLPDRRAARDAGPGGNGPGEPLGPVERVDPFDRSGRSHPAAGSSGRHAGVERMIPGSWWARADRAACAA